MSELNPEEIVNALNGAKSRAKTLILTNLNLLVCILIVVALGFYKFSKFSFEPVDPLVAITDALALYAMAIAIFLNMHWQYQKKALTGETYKQKAEQHMKIVGTINANNQMNGLTEFCKDFPLEELTATRKKILEAAGLTYENFLGSEGKKGYKDMSPKEIRALKYSKKQIKAILAAVDAEPRRLSIDELISISEPKRGNSFIRAGKNKITARDVGLRLARYLFVALGVSWYSKKLLANFSWDGLKDFFMAVAVLAFAAFSGARAGTDAVIEHEVGRINDQCDILLIYCGRKGVKIL
jgi:hypothetical protein